MEKKTKAVDIILLILLLLCIAALVVTAVFFYYCQIDFFIGRIDAPALDDGIDESGLFYFAILILSILASVICGFIALARLIISLCRRPSPTKRKNIISSIILCGSTVVNLISINLFPYVLRLFESFLK